MNISREEFYRQYLIKASISLPQLYSGVQYKRGTWLGTNRKHFGTVLKENESWVEICFQGKTKEESTQKYNEYFIQKSNIERIFGENLRWEKSENTIRCKIMSSPIPLGFKDADSWKELIILLNDKMSKLITATEDRAE